MGPASDYSNILSQIMVSSIAIRMEVTFVSCKELPGMLRTTTGLKLSFVMRISP